MARNAPNAKSYHHGNLKEALIDAAEALLAEEGIEQLSLRAVARRSGVSQAAPYAHFSDKLALLAAVATRGFVRFTDYLHQAEKDATDDASRRTRLLGRAYVAFALDYPELFRLMFSSELHASDDPQLRAACDASYVPLQTTVAEQAKAEGVQQYADDASLAAWALVHGLVMLILNGTYPWPDNAASRDALVDRIVSVYSIAAMKNNQ